ncbi:MAG: GNAT family N-acetyltransferase [Ignavibacteriae bacterium]|nr:GNAT family N-acetyltransferase [Ignavibacteriota bacterium]
MKISEYTDSYRQPILDLWARALPLDAVSQDVFEARVLLDENFDPTTAVIALVNNVPVGFIFGAHAKRMPLGDADPNGTRSWITLLAVDPSVSMSEVGGALIEHVENKFKALGKTECYVSTYPPGYFTPGIDRNNCKPLLDLFLTKQYSEVKQALSMDSSIVLFTLSEKVLQKERELKGEGIEFRVYQRTDLVQFMAFLEKSMPTDWVRVERANLKKLGTGGFTPEQITIVTHGEKIIGYCQFEGSHFGPFGVSDEYQGRGIGTVLLARTLDRMRTCGYHDAWVMWTDDLAAKVYAKFGFKETRRFSILQKQL